MGQAATIVRLTTADQRMTDQQENDQQLVARVQKGDRRAFDLLVIKYQHRILALVSRFVPDFAEAQDVAQEAFVKAYRALPNFRGDSQFYTWMYRIAVKDRKSTRLNSSHVRISYAVFCLKKKKKTIKNIKLKKK